MPLPVPVQLTMDGSTFDVESYRDQHESNSEWRMRREFLLKNHEAIPLDRLICLSRCFISIEVYGCSYPDAVMAQVAELSQAVDPAVMAAQRERMQQKYDNGPCALFRIRKLQCWTKQSCFCTSSNNYTEALHFSSISSSSSALRMRLQYDNWHGCSIRLLYWVLFCVQKFACESVLQAFYFCMKFNCGEFQLCLHYYYPNLYFDQTIQQWEHKN